MIVSSVDLARHLFESSRDGLLQISPTDGRIIDANAAAEQLSGLPREQLLLLRADDLLHGQGGDASDGPGQDEPSCQRLVRCEQPDLLVEVSRYEITDESEPRELVVIRENAEFRPADYPGWIDPVVVTDATGQIAWANPAFQQLSGRDEQVSSIAFSQMFDGKSQQLVTDRLRQLHEIGLEVVTPATLMHAGSGSAPVEMWSRPVTYHGQRAALNIVRDLTDQKRVDAFYAGQMQILEQLALGDDLTPILESLIRLIERLFDGTRASVLLLDEDGVTLRHGAAPSLPDAYNALINELQIGPEVGSCGTAVWRKERVVVFDTLTDPLWAEFRELAQSFEHRACWSQPVLSAAGEVLGTFALYYRQPRGPSSMELELIEKAAHLSGIAIQRSRSEAALRASQHENLQQRRELELILDAVQAQVVYMDSDARVVRHNRYSREFLGRTDEEIRGQNVISQAPHLDDPELRHEESLEVIRTGLPRLGSIESFEENGGRRWVSIDKVPTFDDDGKVNGLLLFIYDITQLKQAENLVRESEQRFRQLAENIGSAFWMTADYDHTIAYVSPPFERMFGRTCEDVYQNPERFLESVVPEDRERVRRKIEQQLQGESTIEEYRIRRPDGSVRWIRDQAFPICDETGRVRKIAGLAEDVTELKTAESRIREHEGRLTRVARLSTVGEMAASIVHELTQPLTAIKNYASVGRQLVHAESGSLDVARLQVATDCIVQQSMRASEIISRVRQLITQSEPQRSEHDLNSLIRNALLLMDADFRSNSVQVETRLSPEIYRVRVDSIQIEQTLINLLRNAVDAMSDNPRADRRVWVTSEQTGDTVVVAVRDNGRGFGDVDPNDIFDMFFTTRATGMGMGLSISRTIARAHGGLLEVGQAKDRGAVFRLSLPAGDAVAILTGSQDLAGSDAARTPGEFRSS